MVSVIRRLLSFVSGQTAGDSVDTQMHQELLLPGHIYAATVKVGAAMGKTCKGKERNVQ